ncbi:hypothetical protein Tco_1038161 [Tanacetum coccineum]
MSTLTFADTHNMVAFLEKPAKSDGFHEIIDFLNANQIPLIDKKKLIITETSIRSDLYLEDAGDSGIPTDYNQTPIATQPSSSKSQKKQSRRKQRKDTIVIQEETQQDDSVPTPYNDPPLSGEDSMQLYELMLLSTNLQKHVLNIEKAKDAQVKEIADLKMRVQRLERKKEIKNYRFEKTKESWYGRSDDADMFDIDDLHGDEVNVDMPVGDNQEQSVKEREVDTSVKDIVTTAATTTTTTGPKARGVVVQEPSEFITPQEAQPLMIKDNGKAIMIEPELEAELIEEEKLARKQEEEANIALIESWYNTKAMMEADFELAQKLQTEEQGEITIEERSRLFVELMNKRNEHFAMLRAEEKRRKLPTKAQKRNQMSTYLKNMGGYKHNQLKSKSFEEIQKMFDKEIRRVNTFIPMDSEVVKSKKGTEESSKGTEDELESDKSKKPESSKKKAKGSRKKMLDGSSKRYSSMIRILQDIDREDLETLWKLVKTKHGDTRPEDEHERVLMGDLKVMFKPDIRSEVWTNLQGYIVNVWKLYDSCGVHFVRFGNVYIFMLVEKRYPLTPITITNMLNKKLQTDHFNEMCYQLLKLMIPKMNIKFRGGLLRLKRLQGFLELLLLSVAGEKVYAAGLQLLEDLLLPRG